MTQSAELIKWNAGDTPPHKDLYVEIQWDGYREGYLKKARAGDVVWTHPRLIAYRVLSDQQGNTLSLDGMIALDAIEHRLRHTGATRPILDSVARIRSLLKNSAAPEQLEPIGYVSQHDFKWLTEQKFRSVQVQIMKDGGGKRIAIYASPVSENQMIASNN